MCCLFVSTVSVPLCLFVVFYLTETACTRTAVVSFDAFRATSDVNERASSTVVETIELLHSGVTR